MFLQGDKLEIVILNASGIRREYMELRKDWCFYTDLLFMPDWDDNVWNAPWIINVVVGFTHEVKLRIAFPVKSVWTSARLCSHHY